MSDRMYVVWIDVNGSTKLTLINTLSGASTILGDMLGLTLADVLNTTETSFNVNPSPIPSSGTYQSVRDCASLLFVDGSGNKVTLQLPAPKSTIFMSDQETVDPSQVTTLVNDCIGNLITSSGGSVTAFIGGIRRPTTRELYQ